MYKKGLSFIQRNFVLFLVPIIIIGWISFTNLDYLIVSYNGIDKTFHNSLKVVTVLVPLILTILIIYHSPNGKFTKIFQLAVGVPIVLLASTIIDSQCVWRYANYFARTSNYSEYNEKVKIDGKSTFNSHGKKYSFDVIFENKSTATIPSDYLEFEKYEIGDSVKVRYFINENGTLFLEYGRMRE